MNTSAVCEEPLDGIWLRKMLMVFGFVLLSVGLAIVGMVSLQKAFAHGKNNPVRYAARTTHSLDKKLQLTLAQQEQLKSLLADYRSDVNGIDRDELALWETLLSELPNASLGELQRRIQDINVLQQRRTAARLKSLVGIDETLAGDQKEKYSQLMVEWAQQFRRQQSESVR